MSYYSYKTFLKIEHTLFSLPILFAGAWMAIQQWPPIKVSLLILFAGASARVVALGFNRIIDREIDRLNPRTKDRPLANGSMHLAEAWTLVILCLSVYLFCAWSLSEFCLKLSWIPILAFGAYPYFKRFTKWAHLGLGLVWSLVPLGGFFAVNPSLNNMGPVLLLAIFCVFWLMGFDIIYSLTDEQYDRESGLHSLPARLGKKKALWISGFSHILAFVSLSVLYVLHFSGPITVLLLIVIGILLFLEQKFAQYVDFAFFHVNAVLGFVVFFFVMTGLKGI